MIKHIRNHPIDHEKWYPRFMNECEWKFEGKSGIPEEPFTHWTYRVAGPEIKKDYLVQGLWEDIEPNLPLKLKPRSVFANLYNHGDSSWVHPDPHDYSVVCFLNPEWDKNWDGLLIFLTEDEKQIKFACFPEGGTYVLFESYIPHKPVAVSREAKVPRLAVTYQCEFIA